MAGQTATGLREAKKQRTREAIESAAWDLFLTRGYDATTIEDIADAADVAPRTFFRYYGSKEAVLFGDWEPMLPELRRRVLERPEAEHPRQVVEAAVLGAAHRFEADRPYLLLRARLAATSTNVGSYYRQVFLRAWEDTVAEALAERLGVAVDGDVRPRLWAGTAAAAILAARDVWLAGDGRGSLPALIHAAFDELAGDR